ncbi:MAG: 50S ribosomal protein L6 [Alphaproteobacteria bacterium]|nr:50S ribosomal protein L6 [Alphaproteobacteria bacterium]
MSRVGQVPVKIPAGVNVTVAGETVTAKGKLGELSIVVHKLVEIVEEGDAIVVKPREDSQRAKTLWGTTRANINNMVRGVSEGFTRNLDIVGVGYRAAIDGKTLVLQLGYSHDVRFPIPSDIAIKCERPTAITISGADRQKVGQVAAVIRGYRKPEPYKGKGIKYSDEILIRKEGKKK